MQHFLASAAVKATQANACLSLTPKQRTSDHSIFSPIAKPIADVLAAFYAIVPNYGVDIILLSIVWMLIIAPLTLKSTRSMLAMQKLQPQLKKLQAEHKNDRQAFAAAQMELFKEHNVSPFGSCLPTLLPLPVFFALFRVIDGLSHKVTVTSAGGVKSSCAVPSFLSSHTQMYKAIQAAGGHINAFGLDLSHSALSGHSSFAAAIPFYVLLLIMIGTQYLQTVQMMSRNPAANDNPQMKMMKYLPIFFGVICIRFPAGVILYYAMSNICRMGQQAAMYRYDPKVKALVAQEVIEVEAITRDIDRQGGPKARKAADTPPARSSRFRDALSQASKQAAEARDKKSGGAATTNGNKTKPGAPTRPATAKGGRPATSGAPGGTKGSVPRKPTTGTKPTGSGTTGPRADAPKPGTNGRGGPANGKTGSTANGAPKAPANGAPEAPANGNGHTAAGGGTTNGNGAAKSTNGAANGAPKPSRTGAGSGRTGASQSRTARKRRGR
jgi:YidC/Oxa1 family membrane protein insertase